MKRTTNLAQFPQNIEWNKLTRILIKKSNSGSSPLQLFFSTTKASSYLSTCFAELTGSFNLENLIDLKLMALKNLPPKG